MEKQNKNGWRYALCAGVTAVVVFGMTMLGCTLGFRLREQQAAADAPAYLNKLEELVGILDEKYVDGLDMDALDEYLSEAAVAATGDRWSYYISPENLAAYIESNANAYVGIGVTIAQQEEGVEPQGLVVKLVTPNGPADKAGIQVGDVIVAVEGESTAELGMAETKDRVRGQEGTDVQLTLVRDGAPMDVTVTRATIEIEIVSYSLLDDAIGYVKINNFDSNSARDTLAAIEELREQGAESLVFDLRFNPGGMKNELLKVLDYLLPEGPLFTSEDYQGNVTTDYSDENYLDMPMAVLVNGDSYSAAEFFAAALQEYGVAKVVGTQTCGKGNYQQTFPLSDGSAVAVSTGHYKTPKSVTLTGVGVTPDVIVEVDEDTYVRLYNDLVEKSDDAQLQAAISALKAENP